MHKLLMEADLKYLIAKRDPDVYLNPAIVNAALGIASMYESEKGKADGWDNQISLDGKRFSFKEMRARCATPEGLRMLQEANPASAFGQLLRAGIQMIANGQYKRTLSTWQEVAQEYASDKRMEFHAPLYGSAFPRKVGSGTPFPEQQVKGQDVEIVNIKFGGIEAFERELFDDDQTGQIKTRAQNLGEVMRVWEDAYFSRRFVGTASTDFPEPILASNFSDQNYVNFNGTSITTPFSTAFYATSSAGSARGNRPAAFVRFNFNSVLDAVQALRQAIDPLGVAIVVNPDYCLVSPFDELEAKTAFNSPSFPASVGTTVGTTGTGFFRGAFANNPIQNMMKVIVNVHLKTGVWAVGQAQKGYVFQRRDPMEIVQEVPNSGDSFNFDNLRFRSRSRWEQEWIYPGFTFLGNDGSVVLTTH